MRPALVETGPAHWVTSFITSRPVCVYSCSQLRELWFNDLFMYMLSIGSVEITVKMAKTVVPTFFYHTSDLVAPHVSGKVMFIDSTLSVEIVLFQLSQVY